MGTENRTKEVEIFPLKGVEEERNSIASRQAERAEETPLLGIDGQLSRPALKAWQILHAIPWFLLFLIYPQPLIAKYPQHQLVIRLAHLALLAIVGMVLFDYFSLPGIGVGYGALCGLIMSTIIQGMSYFHEGVWANDGALAEVSLENNESREAGPENGGGATYALLCDDSGNDTAMGLLAGEQVGSTLTVPSAPPPQPSAPPLDPSADPSAPPPSYAESTSTAARYPAFAASPSQENPSTTQTETTQTETESVVLKPSS